MKRAGHVARIGEMINEHNILTTKIWGKREISRCTYSVEERIILK
jgi:hypothetical protein